MLALNRFEPVSDWAVDFVLATADVEDDGLVAREEINHALAMWRVLVRQQDAMEAAFDEYDAWVLTHGDQGGRGPLGLTIHQGYCPFSVEFAWD